MHLIYFWHYLACTWLCDTRPVCSYVKVCSGRRLELCKVLVLWCQTAQDLRTLCTVRSCRGEIS